MATTRSVTPRPQDLLDLASCLSEEELAVRSGVRRLVDEQVLPSIGEWFEREHFPRELVSEFAKLGLLGMHLEGYGCAGTSAVAYGLACQELEAGDSGIRSFVSVQGSLAMFPIHAYGSEDQRERWLPAMATGEAIGCFGLTEPDAGSNPNGMRTSARRDGEDWILNGTKMWITNGNIADVAVVWAQTDEGIRGFVIETDSPGFTANLVTGKMSLRASVTSELVLEDCRVPDESALPGVAGLRGPLSCLNEARYGIVWGAAGAARACYEAALDYALSREQFGRAIGGFQLTQQKLVNMMLEVQKAEMLALRIGRLKDEGRLHPSQVSAGKLNNCREALAVAREARTIMGANGVTLEYAPIRHANNLESVLTYEGTSEIHTLILGQTLTGMAAFE
jgi:glutaryl-CoA dehydrogenase